MLKPETRKFFLITRGQLNAVSR